MDSLAVRAQVEAFLAGRIPAALELRRPALVEKIPTGIAALDQHTHGGIPRGALTEIAGPVSSGRSSILLSLISAVTARGEACALVDASSSLAPESAAHAGIDLARLLWVRCSDSRSLRHSSAMSALERGVKVIDLLLQSGGFSLVAFDLGDLPSSAARRVSLASWFRFRHAVENTATAFVVLEQEAHAKTCASLVIQLARGQERWSKVGRILPEQASTAAHTLGTVLSAVSFEANIARGKPAGSAKSISFHTRTSWAG